MALRSQWGAYRLAINTLWCGFDVALADFALIFPATSRPWLSGAPVWDPARLEPLRHAGSETGVLAARNWAFPQDSARVAIAVAMPPLAT